MANAFLQVILKLVMRLISLLFTPLSELIDTLIPNASSAFGKVTSFFNLLSQYSSFALSYLGITDEVISIIVLLFVPTITIPLAVHTLKLIVKWWDALT